MTWAAIFFALSLGFILGYITCGLLVLVNTDVQGEIDDQ